MSTNYYAEIKLAAGSTEITTKMHIGRTGRTVTLSGDWFQTFQDWVRFLEFNSDKITIRNEYDAELTLVELVDHLESFSPEARRNQFEFMNQNPASVGAGAYWVDKDNFTFMTGWFM